MPTAFQTAARRLAASISLFSLVFSLGAAAAPGDGMLPREVESALARAKVPREAVTLLVADAEGQRPPRLAWRSQEPVNPASVMKVVTTYAGLDLLGPAYTWNTPVYIDGPVRG
ncbi:MAG: D-alanyl-D-alanine carboxypeptidase, partial [Proteobacteria bacterium]|nr:D-alanyl-D-alanine carboxypeptidase [Pseudomonadota bacterium]